MSSSNEIISYQQLRTFIGLIGIFLPVVLVAGCYLLGAQNNSLQPSISHYYYSKMHIAFVCALCVLGGFLITYKGKIVWESRISNLAGCSAIGVAAFPTQFDGFSPKENGLNQYLHLTVDVSAGWGALHFALAAILFICFIIFCWFFFQQADAVITRNSITDKKFVRRKKLYTICGWGILISILLLFIFFLLRKYHHSTLWLKSTFWFETSALLFFGTAWLVKGSAYWATQPAFKWFMNWLR